MSSYQFFASDKPVKEVKNSAIKLLSINEKIILQCDSEEQLDEIEIINEKGMPEGFLKKYTSKQYIASLTWRYTDRRAEELLHYIKEQLKDVGEIEVWDTWMDEKVEETLIRELDIRDLTVQLIKEYLGKGSYQKPSCLRITSAR